MKAQKLFLALAALIFSISVAQAGETKEAVSAKKQLETQIKTLFNYVPFEDLVNGEECCTLTIKFNVNECQKLENIVVEGDNEDLVHYAKIVLTNNDIIADSQLTGGVYSVSMKFVYKT